MLNKKKLMIQWKYTFKKNKAQRVCGPKLYLITLIGKSNAVNKFLN